jgi:hypothetical protein
MNEAEQERFEMELGTLRPAALPETLAKRLAALPPPRRKRAGAWRVLLRRNRPWCLPLCWWAPAAAGMIVVGLLAWQLAGPIRKPLVPSQPAVAKPMLRADDVEIDQQLVAVYDAIARLPGGEPVRFRCLEWRDEVVLRDSAQGVVIEQSTPRLEILPVRFETD